jgi:hypothetical protein
VAITKKKHKVPIPNKKPPTIKTVYEGVECYLSPKQIQYCKNVLANGGNRAKAARDSGYSSNYPYSKGFKDNKYIPLYMEKLRRDFMEFGAEDGSNSETYVDHIKKNIGRIVLKRLVDIANFRQNRVQKWGTKGETEYIPDDEISPEDMAAIKGITSETTEFFGKNPRKTVKMKIEVYSATDAIKEIRDMIGLDFKKDQDSMYLIDQLKNMLVNQKKEGIFPTMPTPETDPTIMQIQEEEDQIPMSEVTRH